MSAVCPKCAGTGETGHYGIIDCQAPGCTAADERVALEAAVDAAMPLTEYDQRWMAYRLGQASPSPRQQYWTGVADGLSHIQTAAERAEEDRHHKPHAVYAAQEVADLRARLEALTKLEK